MDSEPFNAGRLSGLAGCSGGWLGQSVHDGEGGVGKEGKDILRALLCRMTHSHGFSPVSAALALEACTRDLPSTGSTTGWSQMDSLGGRRVWQLEGGFWDEIIRSSLWAASEPKRPEFESWCSEP